MAHKVKIYDMEIKYDTDYRNIKYPRLEFKTGELLLVLPQGFKDHSGVLEKHKSWIYKKNSQIINAFRESKNKKLNTQRTEQEFKTVVKEYAHKYLKELDLNVNSVQIKRMNSKWGSCSSRKNVIVNSNLRYLPTELIDYVVYHEIAHLEERKHNEKFWKIVSKKFKDYQNKEKELFVYWFLTQNLIKK